MGKEMRSWRIAQRSDKSLTDLARMFNSVVQGWINYYGRFYKSMLYPLLRRSTACWWAGLARSTNDYAAGRNARENYWLARPAGIPNVFAHWRFGLKPDGWAMGAV
jgi:RNA-directed DNA polymerase